MKRTDPLPINLRLRAARVALGLSARQVAEATGYTREQVAKFETGWTGQGYSAEFIHALAAYLDVPVSTADLFEPVIAAPTDDLRFRAEVATR